MDTDVKASQFVAFGVGVAAGVMAGFALFAFYDDWTHMGEDVFKGLCT